MGRDGVSGDPIVRLALSDPSAVDTAQLQRVYRHEPRRQPAMAIALLEVVSEYDADLDPVVDLLRRTEVDSWWADYASWITMLVSLRRAERRVPVELAERFEGGDVRSVVGAW